MLRPVLAAEECRSAAAATAGENASGAETPLKKWTAPTARVRQSETRKGGRILSFSPWFTLPLYLLPFFIGALFFCSIVFLLPSFAFDCREKDMLVFVR
jgi:hypothetical protein